MASLLEKIREQKAAQKSEDKIREIKAEDISLRGTGLTKREAEKNTRAYEREAAKSVKADKTLFVSEAEKEFQEGIEATIEAMRKEQMRSDIVFDDSQLTAIAGILHNKVSVLIGAAGTGKTTVTKKIIGELIKRTKTVNLDETMFVTVNDNDEEGNKIRMLLKEARRKNLEILNWSNGDRNNELIGVAGAAYTGRAAQQFKRVLPEKWQKNISTIHSLLGYAPVFEEVEYEDEITHEIGIKTRRIFRPSFDAACKLPYTIYFLDEGGMIPVPLFNELIDAIPETSRIVIIGDIHQLPPVYGKSVLGYAMRKWPVYELTTIHRQKEGNAIIDNAHRVLNGRMLENAKNFHLIGTNRDKVPAPGGAGDLQVYFKNVVKKLNEMKLYDPYKDAIIVPQNKGMVGCIELNEHFVTMFNPEIKENGIIVNKRINIHTGNAHAYFAIRDKVMIVQNINNVEPPITNGMIGIVESINVNSRYDMKRAQVNFDTDDSEEIDLDLDAMNLAMNGAFESDEKKEEEKEKESEDQRQSSHVMTIKFENGQTYTCSTAGDYRRVMHGYAATCHKSQGGEYPNVIILCHSVNAVMLNQEWLYTAITRARNNVYIVCNNRGLDQALKRQVIKGKTLQEKIQSYIIETKSDDLEFNSFDTNKYPILWDAKKL